MRSKKKEVKLSMAPDAFSGIYTEIANEIDIETAIKIHGMLHGQVVIFPQKLFSRDYVRRFVIEHRHEYSVRELAVMFSYSDRRIREFLSEEQVTVSENK